MAAYLGYTMRMKTLFVADQLWLMTCIQQEEEDGNVVQRMPVEVDQRGADAPILRLRQSADFDKRSASTG